MKISSIKILSASLTACLSLLLVFPVFADFEQGMEANRNSDRVTAFNEFHAAAKEGDNRAYGKLASMYLYGLGTEKNYPQAYVWFQIAHLAGEREAERFRNTAASMLTRDELAAAEEAAAQQARELGLE